MRWPASVFDLDEEEASCRCGWASGVSVAGGEDCGNGVGGDAPGSGFDEGSDEIADHVVEEARACDAVGEESARRDAKRSGGWFGGRG